MNTEKAVCHPVQLADVHELVGLGDHQFGAAERVPTGHEERQVEQVEGDHEPVDRVGQHGRSQEREGHGPEFLPARGAVHLGRLIEIRRDALEGPGRDHRVERPTEPRVRGEQGEERQGQRDERDRVVHLAQPIELQGIGRQAEQGGDRAQEHVHGAVVLVEDVAPDRRHHEWRDDDRQDEQRPVHLLEAQARVVQQDRDRHAEDDVDDHVREGPEQIEEQQSHELEVRDVQLALEDPDVVVEPDTVRRDLAAQVDQLEVRERHPRLEQERVERDDAHHDEGRGDVEQCGPGVAARQAQSDTGR